LSNNAQKKVLLVDDEPDITTLLQSGLQVHGFSVEAFNDPKKALSQFKPNYYNAIVLDVRMPTMSGFDLAKKMWAKDPKARICFLSAFEIYENEAQKVFSNFKTHCFIRKPMTPNELAKHIEEHLLTTN
jgi:DNA-binding response OmpR family regulator